MKVEIFLERIEVYSWTNESLPDNRLLGKVSCPPPVVITVVITERSFIASTVSDARLGTSGGSLDL